MVVVLDDAVLWQGDAEPASVTPTLNTPRREAAAAGEQGRRRKGGEDRGAHERGAQG